MGSEYNLDKAAMIIKWCLITEGLDKKDVERKKRCVVEIKV